MSLLQPFADAGVLEVPDVHVARRLAALGGEHDERVLLATALAVRAVRHGSVCLSLETAEATTGVEDADAETVAALEALAWPEPGEWAAVLRGSALVGHGADDVDPPEADEARPLRLAGGLLYLDRYWRQERLVAAAVDDRRRRGGPAVDLARLRGALDRLFPGAEPDRQRLAAAVATQRWLTVLAGGPGTGKTTTVARLLAALRDQPGRMPRIALAAPTGKAAARLEEAVHDETLRLPKEDRLRATPVTATTIHRLLGWRPGARTRFAHHRDNRLPFDVVVVDEASMVSLTLMARLVDALRPEARLVLVGDPDQLASVEAGAVLGDLVRRPAPQQAAALDLAGIVPQDVSALDSGELARACEAGVVTLTDVHRHGGDVRRLAEAVRAGDPEAVVDLLTSGSDEAQLLPAGSLDEVRAEAVRSGAAASDSARRGDAMAALRALGAHRLLCAHREGPVGVSHWSRQVEDWLREAIPGYGRDGTWYVGRPLLVTANDRDLGLYNGDTGVVVDLEGRPQAVFPKGAGFIAHPANRLGQVTTVHAMSVHKSQGSQFDAVTLVLPPASSPLLTRELLYTAVTRATRKVRLVGDADAVRAAVARRIRRASGLAQR